jgi:hypothetical protein
MFIYQVINTIAYKMNRGDFNMVHNPFYVNVLIQPIFITNEVEHHFEGLVGKDEGIVEDAEDEQEEENMEYIFIEDVLNHYFGVEHLEFNNFNAEIIKGRIEIAFLTIHKLQTLHGINEYSSDYPIKYGASHLKFNIIRSTYQCECELCYECDCDRCSN